MNSTRTDTEPDGWPQSFAEVKASPPRGFSVSGVVHSPAILISKSGKPFAASLVACITRQGQTSYLPVVRDGANYVADGQQLKPLPKDADKYFRLTLKGKDPASLTLPEVLSLMRSSTEDLPVIIDDTVFESANTGAAQTHLQEPVPGLVATLYPYQDQGIAWMRDCIEITGGLILADEMGLGKSLQVIALLLLYLPTNESPALIVCPTTLIANWTREISRFAPGLTIMVHRGAGRAGIYKRLMATQVVITTYDTVVSDISIIRSVHWSFVVADEAQAIKNPDSLRRQALIQAPRRRAIAVTGTPVENSLKDLWSLADFAIPGILGTESEFDLHYQNDLQGAQTLSRITGPVILKRKIADVAKDLPERIDCDLPIELGDGLAREYERIRQETLTKYPVAGSLVATGQLQLFCAHPWLRSNNPTGTDWEDNVTLDLGSHNALLTPKMARTIELLEEAFTSGKKVLIFSIFNQIGDLIREAGTDLAPAFWNAINGSTEQFRRQEIVDEFTAHDGPGVLILNPKAAGTGLNITAATIVIHYTQVWNPAIEAQASARAHRRGQELPVTIYRLYYEDTVERVMLDRMLWKKNLANDAVVITPERNRSDLAQALALSPATASTELKITP
jgi:SNF2 family DNA or RNA helicase